VQTDVVYVVVSCAARIQSTIGDAPRDEPTGDEQHVGRRDLVERVRQIELEQIALVGERPFPVGAHDHVDSGDVREHGVRADGVEGGEPGVEADGDLHVGGPFRKPAC
jgi:hypothetical protein